MAWIVVMWLLVVLVLILSGQVVSQCFTVSNCTRNQVPAGSERECCVETDTGLSYNDGGTCTMCIVHGFSQAVYTVMEDGILNTRFQLNAKGMTNFPGLLNFQGAITSMEGGDATPGSDFSNIQPNTFTNEADIRLFPLNDATTLEYNEYVTLTFTAGNPAAIDGLEGAGEYVRTSAIVNIIDNDRLEINFEESDYYITEGSGLIIPICLRFRSNQNAFNVTFTPVTIDVVEGMGLGTTFINSDTIEEEARAERADFTHLAITIEIPAATDDGTQVFVLPNFFQVIDDDIDEVEQSFAIVAELGPDVTEVPFNFTCFQLQAGETECFGRRGVTEIRITDNDPMIIGFTSRSQTVSEGDAPLGSDFNTVVIDVATKRISERIHVIVFRHLESASTAIVQSNVIVRDPLFDALFGNEDNDPLEESFPLLPGESEIPSRVTEVLNDFRPEDDECYTIGIFPADITGARELFTCNDDDDMADGFFCLHTICILDDDDPFVVAFVQTMYTVVESEGPVEVCVNLTRPPLDILEETVRVYVTNDEGSIYIPAGVRLATPDTPDFLSRYRMAGRADYAEQTIGVNAINDQLINATRRIVCYNQPIYDDGRLEVSEYAGLTLDVDENERGTTIRTEVQDLFDFASIRIVDDDRARVGLERTFYNVSEGVGVVELCAVVYEPNITCPTEFPFNVSLSTADGTAGSSTDYETLGVIFQFPECETKQCILVHILNDGVDESEEFFNFTLARTPGLDSRIDLDSTVGQVVINENNVTSPAVTVGYELATYTTSEGEGSLELNITVFTVPTDGTPPPFFLSVNTEDGSAVAPGDYGAVTNEIITFTTGQMRATHTITINQDDICENSPNENFVVAINSDLPIINVTRRHTEVIIDDSECTSVGYNLTTYTTSEGQGLLELSIFVLFPTDGAPRQFTVSVNTEDGSAVAPGDYRAVTNEIIPFTAGQMIATYTLIINQDESCENSPNENFFSNFALNSGQPPIFVTRPRVKVIIDDSPQLECSITSEVIITSQTVTMTGENSTREVSITSSLTVTMTGANSSLNDLEVSFIAIAAVVAVLLVASMIVLGVVIYRHKIVSNAHNGPGPSSSIDLHHLPNLKSGADNVENQYVMPGWENAALQQSSLPADLAQQLQNELSNKNMIFQKSQLHLGEVVGQGESGLVYRGYFDSGAGRELVAIKTVKALSSPDDKVKLLKEVLVMVSFKHPNVMSLLGMCYDEETPLLIMPYMSGGNILKFVRQNKVALHVDEGTKDSTQIEVGRKTCLDICYQVSKGMSYLAKHKFVHRDLAARNCMIDQNGAIKVADFGLTEVIYSTNYFRRRKSVSGSEEKVPIRWMAPESIENCIYSEASDMWSFGVTCWEVFTCGAVPYTGVPPLILLRELTSGHRLPRPANAVCSDDIWHVMSSCWSEAPHDRPRFATLEEKLSQLLESYSDYVKLSMQ